MSTRAAAVLDQAAKIVRARGRTHGEPLHNHSNIARLWNAYLAVRANPAAPITAADAATMMLLVKLARMHTGRFNADDDLDVVGYGAVLADIRAQGMKR
jgi:hypothetical protein